MRQGAGRDVLGGGSPPHHPPQVSSALAPPPRASPSESRELDRLARAAVDAQLAYTNRCHIAYYELPATEYASYDVCPVDAEARGPAIAAADDLARFADAHPFAREGEAATFVATATLCREWLVVAGRTGATRGTAALWQSVAAAWNAWKPATPVPLDPPHLVDVFFGIDTSQDSTFMRYMKTVHGDGYNRRELEEWGAKGTAFVWRRGSGGVDGPHR